MTQMQKVLSEMNDDELRDLAGLYEEQLAQVEGEQARRAAEGFEEGARPSGLTLPAVGATAQTLVAECNPVDDLARRLAFGG